MKNTLLSTLIIILLFGCSSKNANKSGGIDLSDVDETPIEEVASTEVIPIEESGLLSKEEVEISASSLYENAEQYAASSSIVASDATAEEIVDDENYQDDLQDDSLGVVSPNELDKNIPETVEYVVQKNETLMLIAHKLYGDYRKWKSIQRVNGNLLFFKKMGAGTRILVPTPDPNYSPSQNGTPYLIKTGDTLGKVSNHAYQIPKHWKYIWDNNKDVIKDPNLIFAGFTLYYLPLEEAKTRDLASDPEAEL